MKNLAIFLILLGITSTFAFGVAAVADAAVCKSTWVVGVGGLSVTLGGTGQDSAYIASDQRVGYNSADPESGVSEVDRLVRLHRAQCPRDHIKLVGHSGGAGVIHVWVSAHRFGLNVSAVLIADPKRAPGPGSGGFMGGAASVIGGRIAGTDANFGTVPVLTICNHDDVICNEEAGWFGYLFTNAHGRYNYNGFSYANNARGVAFK